MDSPDGQKPSRRTSGSNETRLRLLRAAGELIAEAGWGSVTTRAVAARAGLPHGAVSYHFRGKEELLTEAALRVFEEALPLAELEAMADVADVMALLEGWLSEQDAEGDLVSRVGIEAMLAAERNAVLRERLAELLDEFRGVVARLVESGQTRGTVPPGVSAAAVATLVAAVGDGLFLHTRLDPELDTRAAVDTLRALLGASA